VRRKLTAEELRAAERLPLSDRKFLRLMGHQVALEEAGGPDFDYEAAILAEQDERFQE
jgi:hypothetical protein